MSVCILIIIYSKSQVVLAIIVCGPVRAPLPAASGVTNNKCLWCFWLVPKSRHRESVSQASLHCVRIYFYKYATHTQVAEFVLSSFCIRVCNDKALDDYRKARTDYPLPCTCVDIHTYEGTKALLKLHFRILEAVMNLKCMLIISSTRIIVAYKKISATKRNFKLYMHNTLCICKEYRHF